MGHRRRRRGARGGGERNVTNDEFDKYTEKTKMKENKKNQDSNSDLPGVFTVLPKTKVIPGSIRTFWYKGSAEIMEK